jgi:D-tyrosyl-tRNA(Tyr) deacylase
MRLVIQRVLNASVLAVDEARVTGSIGHGLMVLVGLESTDTEKDLVYCANKLVNLKLFSEDATGEGLSRQWKRSVMETQGGILLVSQFTLYARTTKGTKPDFHLAMAGPEAHILFNKFVDLTRSLYPQGKVEVGAFGQYMNVSLVNDGPVTIIIDSPKTA